MAIPAADDFNRSNGALGVTSVGARTWVTSGSGFAVTTNKAAFTGASDAWAVVDSGVADGYAIEFTLSAITGQWPFGVICRATSETVGLKLYRDNGGSGTWNLMDGVGFLASVVAAAPSAGDVIKVVVRTNNFKLYINNVLKATYDYTGSVASAGTYQGIAAAGGLALTVDDFSISAPDAPRRPTMVASQAAQRASRR